MKSAASQADCDKFVGSNIFGYVFTAIKLKVKVVLRRVPEHADVLLKDAS